jgi:hypothetical protein
MPASRSVVSVLLRELGDFLYALKAGPAGGHRRRPSSRQQRHGGHRDGPHPPHRGEPTPHGRLRLILAVVEGARHV